MAFKGIEEVVISGIRDIAVDCLRKVGEGTEIRNVKVTEKGFYVGKRKPEGSA